MAKKRAGRASLREALEEALAADPDDVATHAAYADYLMEQPAPADRARGELIRTQLALEDGSRPARERKELQRRERELLDGHRREWLGELAALLPTPEDAAAECRRGWLHGLELGYLSIDLARALARASQTRLLRILEVGDSAARPEGFVERPDDHIPPGEYRVGICPLLGSPYLGNVRRFRFGADPGDEWGMHNGRAHSGVLLGLIRKMPRLEELELYAEGLRSRELFTLKSLTRLRSLRWYQSSQVLRLDVLAGNAALGQLRELRFHPHHIEPFSDAHLDGGFTEEEGYLPLRVVRPFLHSPHFPNLTRLQLRLSSMGDEGCREIVASGILKRLKVLDLRHGRVTDAGARLLADCPDVRGLESLDLDRNALTRRGRKRLEALGLPHLRAGDQQTAAELAAGRYLCEGDFE